MTTHDPFEVLSMPAERQELRPSFARSLRARIAAELGIDPDHPPTVQLPKRKTMSTTTTAAPPIATAVTPYLTAHDAAAALDWYAAAFGAIEHMRVVGDDGRIGHAEFAIGDATFYLSDEYPDLDVRSPRSLGGTGAALHLQVSDVDALYAQAVDAGATAQGEPEDQDHGARHGSLFDPFGHRWMLSQHVEDVDTATYAERLEDSGFSLGDTADTVEEIPGTTEGETIAAADRPGTGGGIWAAVFYRDALAGIRFLVDTFGFDEQLVVVGDDGTTVVHSQLRWPEGGIMQAGTYDPDQAHHRGYADADDDPFVHTPGEQSLYVVTADPQSVWERSQAAGLEVIRALYSPDHDPEGLGFSVRDPEGNAWSFGTYGLGADT